MTTEPIRCDNPECVDCALNDEIARLEKAERYLRARANEAPRGSYEAARFGGKVEGVKLAIGYIEDSLRIRGTR